MPKNYATGNTDKQSLEVKTDEYETNKPQDQNKKSKNITVIRKGAQGILTSPNKNKRNFAIDQYMS